MTAPATGIGPAARRLLPALVILAMVAALVPTLARLGLPMTDAAGRKDYGEFAIGLAAGLFLVRIFDFAVFEIGFRLRRLAPAPELLRQLVSLLLFGLVLGILFQVLLSANLAALLTTSAIITAVLGLALQETLGNFFSGLALALERTVQVGDMIRAGETIGLVEQLSWRGIKLRTMEGNSLIVPNILASRERLEVFRRGHLPMARLLRVGLEYGASPAHARASLEAAIRDLPGLAVHPSPIAYVAAFADYAVVYELRYWLEDYARYLEIDSRVRERVWYNLQREGLVIAYPLIRQFQYAAGPLKAPVENDFVDAAIAKSDLFAPLSAAERQKLAEGSVQRRYAEGETVVHEGDATSSMFLIARGRVGISVHGEGGTSQKLAALDAGSSFGEISLLTGEPRLATVRAITEATLVEIGKATVAPILEANPSLVEKLDRIILERRRHTARERRDSRDAVSNDEPTSLAGKIARFFGLKGSA